MLVVVSDGLGIGGGDAVVEPAVALAAASGGGFEQRSTTAIASFGSSGARASVASVLATDAVVVWVSDTGTAAANSSATLTFDCEEAVDVGSVV